MTNDLLLNLSREYAALALCRRNEIDRLEAKIVKLTANTNQASQEAVCVRGHLDEARDWIRQIMSEAENSPKTEDEWRDGLCRGSIEAVVTQCKTALSEIPEGGEVVFRVRRAIDAAKAKP